MNLVLDFSLVPQLVRAVKDTLRWEEPVVEAPSKQRKYFKYLKKDRPNFPFLGELGEIISDEWGKVEKEKLFNFQDSKDVSIQE